MSMNCIADSNLLPAEYASQWSRVTEKTLKNALLPFYFFFKLAYSLAISLAYCFLVALTLLLRLSSYHYLPSTDCPAVVLWSTDLSQVLRCGYGCEATYWTRANLPNDCITEDNSLLAYSHQPPVVSAEELGPVNPCGIHGWNIDRSNCVQACSVVFPVKAGAPVGVHRCYGRGHAQMTVYHSLPFPHHPVLNIFNFPSSWVFPISQRVIWVLSWELSTCQPIISTLTSHEFAYAAVCCIKQAFLTKGKSKPVLWA